MNNIIGIVVSYIFVGAIIITAKLFEKFGNEVSRKYIHIALCNWWFIAMYFFDNALFASIVPLSFVVINYISYKKNLITVMEREEQDGLGTVYYAASLFILSIVSFGILKNPSLGLAGILVMGYGDGFAAVIGKNVKSKEYNIKGTTKTLLGSGVMFIITFIILSILLVNTEFWYIKAFISSIIITILEAISIKGTDNITVPIVTSILMYWFI